VTFYEYRCPVCGHATTTQRRGDRTRCVNCGASSHRDFRFRTQTAFQPHFNQTLGHHVNNDREFRDGLKRASEDATVKTGMEHDFQPVDLADHQAFGISDNEADEQKDRIKSWNAKHGAGSLA
jgi:DNA-directed RNA polymerase subunit RPC12/RpoP